MNTKQKIAAGLVTLVLLAGSHFRGKAIYSKGYENGRQQGRQEIKTKVYDLGNDLTRKCEDDMKYILRARNLDSTLDKRKIELEIESGCTQERYKAIRALVNEATIDHEYEQRAR